MTRKTMNSHVEEYIVEQFLTDLETSHGSIGCPKQAATGPYVEPDTAGLIGCFEINVSSESSIEKYSYRSGCCWGIALP